MVLTLQQESRESSLDHQVVHRAVLRLQKMLWLPRGRGSSIPILKKRGISY